jgi:hypothetical protein
MNEDKLRTGSCLCGSVQVEVPKNHVDLGVCHCSKCKKWTGGPLMEIECGTAVNFVGKESITVFKSSEWAVRGFCQKCGSHLFIRDEKTGEYGIPPGLFDDEENISFNRQVFFDHKPKYYSFSNTTKNITSDYIYKHFPQRRESNT